MLCTVSRRAQPIHSFKLIIHLDDTVQLFWLDFGSIHLCLVLLQVVKFFVSDQKFIYILCQSQTFCARQKDDLHSVKLVFVPAQKFVKRR